MGLLGPPNFEKLKRNRDMPRLVHWATYTKDPASSRTAMSVLRRDVYGLVEYLYETAVWTQDNSHGNGRRLPRRGVTLLNDAAKALTSIGDPAVMPLVDSLLVYDTYGGDDVKVKLLYFALVMEVLEKMGATAAGGLGKLARSEDGDVRAPARNALELLRERGQLDAEDDPSA